MKGVCGSVVKGWRDYWSRRRYQRLNGRRRRKVWGGRFWRMRAGPKVRITRISGRAKKMVLWLRDAYTRMMMGLATSGVRGMTGADAVVAFGKTSVKEYDRNMILHIYNSLLVASPHRPAPPLPPPN
ncbi:uncharacterized protein LOC114750290 [Neltuma alba]|uniref:uncharacterized protein LOC114738080 n=1 Tax=Neltuma alba TaxID=207710 RepID=UPI0010A33F21|nr:uncharacterized protein LOC114738080 [Prosopis alba]XP_028794696.1 uncharacterized protein LOC114750290 [Prosopis alba]